MNRIRIRCIWIFTILAFISICSFSENIYVDIRNGSDQHPGSRSTPIQTIAKAAELVNGSSKPGPTRIILHPGTYALNKTVLFKNDRPYTEQNRLTIEAAILPDDPNWLPKFMPIVLSVEPSSKSVHESYKYSAENDTVGFKVEINHVTFRGIKFLGNPSPHTWHYPIWRGGNELTDLLVTQCLFVSDKHAIPYLSPICAKGHKIVVDHCIFYNCHTPLIFWDAKSGQSKGCAARYCIIEGALAAVWTTDTAEDFEFHHNIITRSEYVWMRGKKNKRTYRLRDCVITDCKYDSGYGNAFELFGPTESEVRFIEENVIRKGKVQLEQGNTNIFKLGKSLGKNAPRNYLHPTPRSTGYQLKAGLFTGSSDNHPPLPAVNKQVSINEQLSLKTICKGTYLITHRFAFGANSLVVEMKDKTLVLVDTPLTPQATEQLLNWFLEKLGKQKVIAINTGYHWDNLGGNEYLIEKGIAVYGSDLTEKLCKEKAVESHAQMLQWLNTPERKQYANALKNLNFTAPNNIFMIQEGLKLDFAGEQLQVYYPGPTHTPDNVVVYFPDRKVLFGGCMISGFGKLGNTAEADLKAWSESLRKLKQFDVEIIVPGHGLRLYPKLIEENIQMLEKEADPFAGDWQGDGVDSEGNAFTFAAKVIARGNQEYRILILDSLDTTKEPMHVMDGILEGREYTYTADERIYTGKGKLAEDIFEGFYKGPVDGTYKMQRIK